MPPYTHTVLCAAVDVPSLCVHRISVSNINISIKYQYQYQISISVSNINISIKYQYQYHIKHPSPSLTRTNLWQFRLQSPSIIVFRTGTTILIATFVGEGFGAGFAARGEEGDGCVEGAVGEHFGDPGFGGGGEDGEAGVGGG
jgi:hypothetical protein